MQGKRILLATLGLSAFLISAPTLAMMSVPYGWFAEGNVGSTHLSNVSYPGSASSSGIGANLNIGYKFMPFVGAEIGGSVYPNSTIKTTGGTKAASIEHYSYDLAVRGILPISDSGVEAIAKLGVGRAIASTSIKNTSAANSLGISSGTHSATGLYWGIGAQYYWMPELSIIVQWQRAQGNSTTGNEDLFSAGLGFIFD